MINVSQASRAVASSHTPTQRALEDALEFIARGETEIANASLVGRASSEGGVGSFNPRVDDETWGAFVHHMDLAGDAFHDASTQARAGARTILQDHDLEPVSAATTIIDLTDQSWLLTRAMGDSLTASRTGNSWKWPDMQVLADTKAHLRATIDALE